MTQTGGAEERVLTYLRDNLRPGQPLLLSELYNKVFTQPDERQALDKLYRAFFRIPLFVVQYERRFGKPPGLDVIAEQFDLGSSEAADILLRVMEADPRVPRFLAREPKTGQITKVDIERIESDPRFGKPLERQLAGWVGKPAPRFTLFDLDGKEMDSTALRGKAVLLYVWFTGCPPCAKETGELEVLAREFAACGLVIVAANADRLLNLAYDDSARRRFAGELSVHSPIVHWTQESDAAYGGISIFPTLFLIDREGIIRHHWVGFVGLAELRRSTSELLGSSSPG